MGKKTAGAAPAVYYPKATWFMGSLCLQRTWSWAKGC